MAKFDLDPSYKGVPERIADFREKHPDGCLRPVNPEKPYDVVNVDGRYFIVYAAAAYRNENDSLPGIGLAWEPFPGPTTFTKDSELQNAETSAWGRAIVAVLASESKSVASAEDVRNRQASQPAPPDPEADEAMKALAEIVSNLPGDEVQPCKDFLREQFGPSREMNMDQIEEAVAIAAGWPATDPMRMQPYVPANDGTEPF